MTISCWGEHEFPVDVLAEGGSQCIVRLCILQYAINMRTSGILLLACLVISSSARAQHAIAWRPTTGEASVSPEDRQRASNLARQSIEQLELNDITSAEAKLREALAILPGKAVWHFNLACILTGRRQLGPAIDELQRATDLGFTDFTALQGDSALSALHDLPRFQKLIARKDEIRHNAGQRALAELREQFGAKYLYEVDEEQKLIFAIGSDQATLDAVKAALNIQARTQAADLFSHKPDEFIRVVVPTLADYRKLMPQRGIPGIYEDESRTLLAEQLGQVMTHEFTHALHAADQRMLGQEHPIWLREGLASMYEAGEVEEGRLIPRDNFRLAYVQQAARRNALLPLEKMVKLSGHDFANGPNLSYGQTSSLLLYLYDKKLLRKFYEVYKASYQTDRTGAIALEETTGMKLPELQKTWTAWMLERKPPQMKGTIGGPYLGIHFGQTIDGLRVMMVIPASAAAKAGIKNGDVLVGLDDHEVRDYASFSPLLSSHKPGDEVKLKLRRDGKYFDVPVVLGQR